MDITPYLVKRGWTGIDSVFRGKIDQWMEWYQGDVESFHRYSVYNGINLIERRRRGLGMAKTVAEDWANLLLNEKTQISAGVFQDRLDDILLANRWDLQANRLVELAFALGTGALVEYLGPDGMPNIDYIRADMIFPLSWENGVITECAFGSIRQQGQIECVYLQIHRLENGQYIIENHLFDNKTGEELALEGVAEIVNTGSTVPLFQIITPNIVNNVDLDCPMGVSVYANAISALQKVDLVWDSYSNEFELGRKRIFIPMSMAKIEDASEPDPNNRMYKPAFDPRDAVFYALNVEGADKPIDISFTLRTTEHQTGLRDALNTLSLKCGLGTDRYNFEGGGVKTATEVVSEKSDLFQNLKKHEHILTDALTGMVQALAYLCGSSIPDVTVMYDDSIINDDNTKIDNNIKLIQAELKSKLSAIMDIYGYDEKTAAEELERIVEEGRIISGSDVDLFGGEAGPEKTDQQQIGFAPPEEEQIEQDEEQ
nr:phage portal protein [uncultured Solibaculum sp.]